MAPFASINWSKFPPVWGEPLSDLFEFKHPDKHDLLEAERHSIKFYKEMLDEKTYIFVNLVERDGKLAPERSEVSMSEDLLPEIISDILQKVIMDAVMVYTGENKRWDKSELVDLFVENVPEFEEDKSHLKKLFAAKKRAREEKELEFSIDELEAEVRSFLDKLESVVRESV